LNSLLLGSQSASQLTLFAMFWFFPYFRNIPPEFQQERLIPWFLLALLLYPVNATMTANILLMIFLFILMFVFKESFLSSKAAKFILLTIVILFSDKIYQMLSFRINSPNDIDVYLFAYYHFYEVYINLGIYKQMLGWGSDILSSQIKDTNFGLGALIFQAGIILFGSFFVLFYVIYRNLLRVTNWLRGCGTPQLRGTMLLAGMNGILSLGWAVSLIHYTPAVELGGRQMFALHTALCLFLLHRIRSESKLARLQIVQAPS